MIDGVKSLEFKIVGEKNSSLLELLFFIGGQPYFICQPNASTRLPFNFSWRPQPACLLGSLLFFQFESCDSGPFAFSQRPDPFNKPASIQITPPYHVVEVSLTHNLNSAIMILLNFLPEPDSKPQLEHFPPGETHGALCRSNQTELRGMGRV
jgi:hypothetical protein